MTGPQYNNTNGYYDPIIFKDQKTGEIINSGNIITHEKVDKGIEYEGVTPNSWGSARLCKINSKNGNILEIQRIAT